MQSNSSWVAARHQCGSRRCTNTAGGVEACQSNAFLRHFVDVWRAMFRRTEAANIAVAEVVAEQQHEVRFRDFSRVCRHIRYKPTHHTKHRAVQHFANSLIGVSCSCSCWTSMTRLIANRDLACQTHPSYRPSALLQVPMVVTSCVKNGRHSFALKAML